MIKLDLQGYEDLKAKLQSANSKQIHEALTTSAIVVHNEAKMLSPVDTGRLRGSITWQVYDDYAEVGTNVDYAPYLENGTGIYAVNGDGRPDQWRYKDASGEWHTTSGQKPQPFMEPALTNNEQRIIDIFKQKVGFDT